MNDEPTPDQPSVAAVAPTIDPSATPAPKPVPAGDDVTHPIVAESPRLMSSAADERIGRFLRSELEAMRGKRGRKPAEYHHLFSDPSGPLPPAAADAPSPAPRRRRTPTAPRVSSAILGDHSIDELLAKAGTTGSKPAAYTILVAAAEHLAAAGAVTIPIQDDLARQVAEAPARVRRMVEALLAAHG